MKAEGNHSSFKPFGALETVPLATGSKGYHIVAALAPDPNVDSEQLALCAQQFATLVAAAHPDLLSIAYRIALREGRVFVDWLRNNPIASVVAPYSLRATPRATVATPLTWAELATTPPDAFTIADIEQLLDRPDSLAELARTPGSSASFVARVATAFTESGLVLEHFDRFRS